MKSIPLIIALSLPGFLNAKTEPTTFLSPEQIAVAAERLYLQIEDLQFLGKGTFNSVRENHKRSFSGYRGFVAATKEDIYLILGTRLEAKHDDILVIPIAAVEGVSNSDHQIRFKCGDYVIVANFTDSNNGEDQAGRHQRFTQILLKNGVELWMPPKEYKMVGTRIPWVGVPYLKPPIFPITQIDIRRARNAEITSPVYTSIFGKGFVQPRWAVQY
ncbi:MAG: hypothetical protein KJT03_05010 [Verrucomicrobiae bacterium]|nr:hypothetical protein [Verrucomicrobiae bacterium]